MFREDLRRFQQNQELYSPSRDGWGIDYLLDAEQFFQVDEGKEDLELLQSLPCPLGDLSLGKLLPNLALGVEGRQHDVENSLGPPLGGSR